MYVDKKKIMWYNSNIVIWGKLKLLLNMRIWRNRQTRWLRVASRQCIYNLYWLKRIFRFDRCGITYKKSTSVLDLSRVKISDHYIAYVAE